MSKSTFAIKQNSYKWDCNHKNNNPFNNSNLPLKKEENNNEERLDENLENDFSENLVYLLNLKNHFIHFQNLSTGKYVNKISLYSFSILRFNNPYYLYRFLSYCIIRD